MNAIWANCITAEDAKYTWKNVPANRKAGVKKILQDRVAAGTLSAEDYERIVGEAYEA